MKKFSPKRGLLPGLIVFTCCMFISASFSWSEKHMLRGQVKEVDKVLKKPLMIFGSKLVQATKKDGDNLILSPSSIQSALNLVLLGAKNGSITQDELFKTLGFDRRDNDQIHQSYGELMNIFKRITTENKEHGTSVIDMWTRAIVREWSPISVKQSYVDAIKRHYLSQVTSISKNNPDATVKVANEINAWAKEAGFSSDLVKADDLEASDGLTLLSAIRVESQWFNKFEEVRLNDMFYNHGQSLTKGTALVNHELDGKYFEFSEKAASKSKDLSKLEFFATDIELQSRLHFTCFVPLQNGTNALNKLENELFKLDAEGAPSKLIEAFSILDNEREDMFKLFQMPKFNFESDLDLVDPLKSMGLTKVFDCHKSNITEMSDVSLFVSKIRHKAMIEVNESGLKAAAFTEIGMSPDSMRYPGLGVVKINKPFLFVIRYHGIPLFFGRLVHIEPSVRHHEARHHRVSRARSARRRTG